jgi:hypothetical protein
MNTAALSPFQDCPLCGSASVMRLVKDWADGRPIPIVGCGNPWHYSLPNGAPLDIEPTPGLREATRRDSQPDAVSARETLLAYGNGWHGADCAGNFSLNAACSCGLEEQV